MIYRGTGFLAVMYDLAPPPTTLSPLSRQQVVSLSQSSYVSSVELTDGRGRVRGGEGAKLYDDLEAWSSINHSINALWCR
jgi:hypothetical protein